MALTPEQVTAAATRLARDIFGTRGATGHTHSDDLEATIQAIDDTMNQAVNTLGSQTQSMRVNLNQALPEPFKSRSTLIEKGLAIAEWALEDSGAIEI